MSAVGIVGSGFGLYGYLPALVEVGKKNVILPDRYKDKFLARSELKIYADYIHWVSDDGDMFEMADTIVLALPPEYQLDLVKKLIRFNNIRSLLLEKPLAVSPEKSSQLLDELEIFNKKFRISYNFRFTTWGARIADLLKDSNHANNINQVCISWEFLAPHYRNNALVWKRFNSSGGGALRFYGIHIIALLAELGYTKVSFSKKIGSNSNEVTKWVAIFLGDGLPNCDVVVDSAAIKDKFIVTTSVGNKKSILFDKLTPFDCTEHSHVFSGQDKRLPYLMDLCKTLFDEADNSYVWYKNTIELWRLVEDVSALEVG
jgi:predicted dehydrogenase